MCIGQVVQNESKQIRGHHGKPANYTFAATHSSEQANFFK
jgi:hypothetical protein